MNTHSESNQWQFRDQNTPARVCHLLSENKITSADLLIMWAIGSLVKHQGKEDGIGCFATNSYLGSISGVSADHVSGRISHLKKMKLVIVVYVGNQRYLELQWSRTLEEIESLGGEYGEAYREAYQELHKSTVGQKTLGVRSKDLTDGVGLNTYHNNNTITNVGNSCARSSDRHSAISTDTHTDLATKALIKRFDKSVSPSQDESIISSWCNKLYTAVYHHHLSRSMKQPDKSKGPPEFRKLRKELNNNDAEITKILDFYISNIDKPFTPECWCGESFRKKFTSLQAAYERANVKKPLTKKQMDDIICVGRED